MSETMDKPVIEAVEIAPRNARELTLGRLIDASAEALYRCWTDAAVLPTWFAPKPVTTKVISMDVRVGGRQEIVMTLPDGTEHPTGGVYLELVPNRKIVSTDAFTSAWTPGEGTPFMVAEISFEPQADGRTLYVARVGHWSDEAFEQHKQMGFHEGWGICAQQLAEAARAL